MDRFILVSTRFKGGSTQFEKRQMASLDKQEAIDKELEGIDLEYANMRSENQRMYEENYRPMEEDLLMRARGPAREAMSAEARAGDYAASDTMNREAMDRRNARFGISNDSNKPDDDDDIIQAIALSAVGNQSKASALDTHKRLQSASIGIGAGVNQDITRSFGRAIGGMQQGMSHAGAAFSNFSNAQQHSNNAYMAKQQGYGALVQGGSAVVGMGISNYQSAQYSSALSGEGNANWASAFGAGNTTQQESTNWMGW